MPEMFGVDAYSPKEIAAKIETVGVIKANMATLPLVMLGVLAGAFIGLGGLFFPGKYFSPKGTGYFSYLQTTFSL